MRKIEQVIELVRRKKFEGDEMQAGQGFRKGAVPVARLERINRDK